MGKYSGRQIAECSGPSEPDCYDKNGSRVKKGDRVVLGTLEGTVTMIRSSWPDWAPHLDITWTNGTVLTGCSPRDVKVVR
jgi:hypothetical protein